MNIFIAKDMADFHKYILLMLAELLPWPGLLTSAAQVGIDVVGLAGAVGMIFQDDEDPTELCELMFAEFL